MTVTITVTGGKYRPIERRRPVEHPAHVGYAGHVPLGDVTVEGGAGSSVGVSRPSLP